MAEKAKKEAVNETAEKMVTIKIDRHSKDEGDVFVSVNERTWQIKRGVYVEVPECVKEVLDNAQQAEEQALDFIDANSKD